MPQMKTQNQEGHGRGQGALSKQPLWRHPGQKEGMEWAPAGPAALGHFHSRLVNGQPPGGKATHPGHAASVCRRLSGSDFPSRFPPPPNRGGGQNSP